MNIVNTNICECVSCIFEELKKCKMNIEKFTEESRNTLDKIAEFYKTDIKEAIILTLAIETQYSLDDEDDTVGFNDIRRNIECDVMKIIPFKKQILSLIKKHYFLKKYTLDENIKFKINNQVLEALYKNSFEGISNIGEDFDNKYAFIRRFKNMYETDSQIYFQKLHLLAEMEKEFLNIDFVKKMNNLIPKKEDRYIFYDCCGNFLGNIQSNLIATLNDIYSDNSAKRHAKDMADGKSFLIENEFLKVVKRDSIADSILELTDKAKEIFLEKDIYLYEKKFSSKDMLKPEKINEIKLFYSKDNQKQIETLADYLEPAHFKKIQNQLKEKGMKTGFAVLLHGAPGTGKTETVYQVAKKTNRNIIKVDVSKSKSCWFGESEKLIKEIFDRYRSVCKKAIDSNENIPILLFNEADAIFSKRKDVSSGNVAQTENAIQNIILDEMENLEGILIATTNLTDNFDSAFERRFLYKICFDYPSIEARSAIWKSRIDFLSKESIRKLAIYEFSGGQIDNIVRKATMREILTSEKPSYEILNNLCSEEKICKDSEKHRIGFSVCGK